MPPRPPSALAKLRDLADCRAVQRDAEIEERPAETRAALAELVAQTEADLWDGGEVVAPRLSHRRRITSPWKRRRVPRREVLSEDRQLWEDVVRVAARQDWRSWDDGIMGLRRTPFFGVDRTVEPERLAGASLRQTSTPSPDNPVLADSLTLASRLARLDTGRPRPVAVPSAIYDLLAARVGMVPESRNLQRRAVLRAGMLPEQARLLDEPPRRYHVPDYDFGDGRRWEGGSLVPRSSAVDIDAEWDRLMARVRARSHVHLSPSPPILMDLP